MSIKLYSYWRSTAAYRVRLALELKGIDYKIMPVSLMPGVSEHRQDAYRERNPQMLVPFFEDDNVAIGQSMAILEYLEEAYPDVRLLPTEQPLRSEVRSFCNAIACDMHPLMNLRVLQFIKSEFEQNPLAGWYEHWIREGFTALEVLAGDGPFVFGSDVSLADTLLIPQIYNARRFKISLADFPRLVAIDSHCNQLPAFIAAKPDNQPDAT
jgi:maleylacetoacetate isomerase/maleylpyruvate isomerase